MPQESCPVAVEKPTNTVAAAENCVELCGAKQTFKCAIDICETLRRVLQQQSSENSILPPK